VIVPVPIFVQVELTRRLYHGLEMRVGRVCSGGVFLPLGDAAAMGCLLLPRVRGLHLRKHAILEMGVDAGVVEIKRGKDERENALGPLQLGL